jgi:PAS domain S-box-containing protein
MESHNPNQGDALINAAFQGVVGPARVPVLVKNGDGYYIFANRAAETLLGYGPGQIGGLHITDLVDNDPDWLQAEFERFKSQRFWNGHLTFRRREGEPVQAAVNAFAGSFDGSTPAYTDLAHPVPPGSVPVPRAAWPLRGYDLGAQDIRLIQLLAEGFSDREVSSILSRSEWAVTREVSIVLQKMRANSRTEACMRAIKARLIY